MARPVTIALRTPVLTLIAAATAVPIELRPWGQAALSFRIDWPDFAANVAGFLPLGIVLAPLGLPRAALAATLLSGLVEFSQFVMAHRDPSAMDLAANVLGAVLGAVLAIRWRIRLTELKLDSKRGAVALALALALLAATVALSGDAPNTRGATSPGVLEAHWKFDEIAGRIAADSSGHGHDGVFRGNPKRAAGVLGGAIEFDGARDHIDFGRHSAFRLTGSMTISAWIKPSAFPAADTAIFSTIRGGRDFRGYQLDTTIDRGPRTISLKLSNACGAMVARYGATPLQTGRWYHVAGVYNAETRALDVYLNGALDSGALLGPLTGRQLSARSNACAGRPPGLEKYSFAGAIDDVRIYSFALSQAGIASVMRGGEISAPDRAAGPQPVPDCALLSDPEDAKLPAAAAVFGALAAIALLGLAPSAGAPLCAVLSLAAGLLFVPTTASTLPLLARGLLPLASLAGGVSVAVSARRGAA